MRCAVVVPARDEAGAIGEVVRRIAATLAAQVIVVDNGSVDDTAAEASAAGATVVAEPDRGYGHACRRGIVAAGNADVLVFIDGDGSMAPEDIPLLIEPITAGRADLVLGSRRRHASPGSMPPHQIFGNWLAVHLLRRLYGVCLTDPGPFRAVRATLLSSLHLRASRFAYPIDMLAGAARRRARITEVPVRYRPRTAGRSKVGGSLRGSLEASLGILAALARNSFTRLD